MYGPLVTQVVLKPKATIEYSCNNRDSMSQEHNSCVFVDTVQENHHIDELPHRLVDHEIRPFLWVHFFFPMLKVKHRQLVSNKVYFQSHENYIHVVPGED